MSFGILQFRPTKKSSFVLLGIGNIRQNSKGSSFVFLPELGTDSKPVTISLLKDGDIGQSDRNLTVLNGSWNGSARVARHIAKAHGIRSFYDCNDNHELSVKVFDTRDELAEYIRTTGGFVPVFANGIDKQMVVVKETMTADELIRLAHDTIKDGVAANAPLRVVYQKTAETENALSVDEQREQLKLFARNALHKALDVLKEATKKQFRDDVASLYSGPLNVMKLSVPKDHVHFVGGDLIGTP